MRKELNPLLKIVIGGALVFGGYQIGRNQSSLGGEESAETQRPPATESIPTAVGTASSGCDKKGILSTMAYLAQFASEQDCKDFENRLTGGKTNFSLPPGIPTNNGFGGSPKIDGLNK